MLHYLDKYARNDVLVKLIFDHVKNLGVVTLLLTAATWQQKRAHPGWMGLLDTLSGAVLAFIGLALMWMNHENLFYKIRDSNASRGLKVAAALLYAAAFGVLVSYGQRG